MWRSIDVLALPTVSEAPTLDAVARDPIGLNTRLGRFTTFTNVLDLAAITVPDHHDPGPGRGLTLHGPAGADLRLAALAAALGGERFHRRPAATVDVTVVGAHLEHEARHHELLDAGATLRVRTATAASYRLWALPDGRRPALERVACGGSAIEVEVWSLPIENLGQLGAAVEPPLAIGTVALADGTSTLGFVCQEGGLRDAVDVTHHGGWRRWLEHRATT